MSTQVQHVHSVKDGKRFRGETDLVVVTCPACFIKHAIPERLQKAARDYPGDGANGWWIHCPMGHSWYYPADSIEKRLARREDELAAARASRDQLQASNRALKGVVTRTKRRVGNGVCPCCGRTFQQLARHMHAKHPEYAESPS